MDYRDRHVIYLNKDPLVSPIEALFPSAEPSAPIPLASIFAILHLFIHQILILQLVNSSNPFRATINKHLPLVLTRGFTISFASTSVAPALRYHSASILVAARPRGRPVY